jgi:hypothetical protein
MKLSEFLKEYAPEAYEPFLEALKREERDVRLPQYGFNQFKFNKTKQGKRYWSELQTAVTKFVNGKHATDNNGRDENPLITRNSLY